MKTNSKIAPTFNNPSTLGEWISLHPELCRDAISQGASSKFSILRSTGAEVNDIVGEVLKLLAGNPRLIADSIHLEKFLFRCGVNRVVTMGRKNQTRQRVIDDSMDALGYENLSLGGDTPFTALASSDDARAIRNLVGQDREEQEVFEAALELMDLGVRSSTKNIASHLLRPYGQVYRVRVRMQERMSRALQRGISGDGRPPAPATPGSLSQK